MGGKSSPPPPDYSQMAAVTEKGIASAEKLAGRQMDFAERQYAESKPLYERIVAGQEAVQQAGLKQGQEYYDYMKNTFRPLEQGLVARAQEFNTEGYREQMAAKAAADAAQAFQGAQGVSMREATRRGVNPNSGAFGAAQNANAMRLAAQTAGGMTGARQQAESLGYARQLDAVGLGRGLTGASTGAYGVSLQGGQGAAGTAGMPGQQYMQGMQQGAATSQAGYGLGVQGYGNILNNQASVYNTAQSQADPFATIIGTGLGIYAGRK